MTERELEPQSRSQSPKVVCLSLSITGTINYIKPTLMISYIESVSLWIDTEI